MDPKKLQLINGGGGGARNPAGAQPAPGGQVVQMMRIRNLARIFEKHDVVYFLPVEINDLIATGWVQVSPEPEKGVNQNNEAVPFGILAKYLPNADIFVPNRIGVYYEISLEETADPKTTKMVFTLKDILAETK